VPSFCRHNRFIQNCPICREPEPPRQVPRSASSGSRSTASRASTSSGRSRPSSPRGGVRVRQLARATDDGYRSGLVPGLKASADAERLADELAFAATRLATLATDPPGTYAEAMLEGDREEGLWLAFLTAIVCPGDGEDPFAGVRAAHVPWASGEVPDLSAAQRGLRSSGDERTVAGYRAWAARAGSQEAAVAGEAAWTPQRRFDRVFERLSLPGLDRGARFDFLVTVGRLGLADVQGTAMHFGDDATTLAAKRVFGIGDPMLLARRATDLAEAAELPLEALDLALFNWGQPSGGRVTMGAGAADPELRAGAAAALDV
jgi:Alpha-glutamyl/putrescinyl thymine pyrophosphorylase clade 3